MVFFLSSVGVSKEEKDELITNRVTGSKNLSILTYCPGLSLNKV